MTVRYYSSVAAETTLTGGINNVATSITVGSTVGFPSLTPYTLALDYESATEELVEVTAVAGTTLTVTRAIDGTSGISHNAGARVRHVSSARDFTDSRTHENSTTGVHGVSGALVGTSGAQTLSDKTLNNATGTLNRIDILSEGGSGWTTTINGDIDFASTLTSWKRGPAESHEVASIQNNGALVVRNQDAAADSVSSSYRIRVTKDNGSTDIFSVLSGGNVVAFTDDTINGFQVKPRSASNAKAFNVRNVGDSADIVTINNNGRTVINGQNAPSVQLEVTGASGQTGPVARISVGSGNTGRIQEWVNAAGSTVSYIESNGVANFPTSAVATGVVASAGWTISSQVMRKNVGTTYVNITLTRTGADIVVPASGNITPDLQICTVPADWHPGEAVYVHASTGVNSGSTRFNTDNTVDLVDWVPSQDISTGANLRFAYTFVQ